MIDQTDLVDVLVQAADTLTVEYDTVDFLDRLIRRTAKLFLSLDGGILLGGQDGNPAVVASTSARSLLVSALQIGEDEGPCLDALRTGEAVDVVNIAEASMRWPDFSAAAGKLGYQSMHAVPLKVGDLTLGSLNLFFDSPGSLADEDAAAVRGLAAIAAISIVSAHHRVHDDVVHRGVQAVLDSRRTVEHARDVVARRDGVDLDQAFQTLQDVARRQHRPLHVVSDEIVSPPSPDTRGGVTGSA